MVDVFLVRVSSSVMKKIKHPVHVCPPLLLKNIQALLLNRKIANVHLFDLWVENKSIEDIFKMVDSTKKNIFILLIDTFSLEENNQFISRIKNKFDVLAVGVGQGVGLANEVLDKNYFDVFLAGESELEVVSLVSDFLNYSQDDFKVKVANKYNRFKPLEVTALDSIVPLVWEKKELEQYPFLYPLRVKKKIVCGYLMTSRGCAHDCIFCSSAVRKSYGKDIRLLDSLKVVDQIDLLVKSGVNTIYFDDENIAVSRSHIESICNEIIRRKINVNWVAHARIDNVDYELLKLIKQAGCILLLFGVESGCPRIIELLKKTVATQKWSQTARKVFSDARKLGIGTCALFIIGSPTETAQEVDLSIELAKQLQPDLVKVHFFTPYPGSDVFEQVRGDIDKDVLIRAHHYCKPRINVSAMDDKTLEKKQHVFYRKVFLRPGFIISHFKNYFWFYLYNRNICVRLIKNVWNIFS